MKKLLLFTFFYCSLLSFANGQVTLSATERKISDNLCGCIGKVDLEKITDKPSAEKVFVDCFSKEFNLVIQLAEEKSIQISDQPAMRKLGEEVGKNLFKDNCQPFIALSMKMAQGTNTGSMTGTSEGTLKRIDTKDFNYFVITDNTNNEKSFIWLRQFPGSEGFMADTKKFTNKKVKLSWQEIEVYIPSAKNYYKIKEVVGVEVL
ncbi:hypothetical protein TH63_01265 [Rufibacter radiotolerans]|uniref:Uncharacterized protein n=1 Tax=Rufibacter radiotolerans TaxID=1379910 RepID=A0A0H4VL19_9BACT|nr:hypothetical protein [Rufibacter radiotolerans]AKQ44577.1 hypothetical protein TH63_01265 [Rufibacter radiotolerans]